MISSRIVTRRPARDGSTSAIVAKLHQNRCAFSTDLSCRNCVYIFLQIIDAADAWGQARRFGRGFLFWRWAAIWLSLRNDNAGGVCEVSRLRKVVGLFYRTSVDV